MKKIIITTIILGGLAFPGCNKWLDVKPLAQTTKDELFTTQKGFRDALTGAYIHLKSNNIYGSALTFGNIEYLSRNWDPVSGNVNLTNLANANYNDATVRGLMDNTYADEYKVIADVNSILERIDAKKNIFLDNNYRLVKGEALALRAFAHFDILRLFGSMPDNPGTTTLLPYVKAVSKEIVTPVTYQEFAQNILADLNEAEILMKDVDPFTQFSVAELNPSTTSSAPPVVADNYYMYRQLRMNYFAVLALKARVYNWLVPQGDENRVNAMKYAQMVIDAKDRNGVPIFRLGKESDRTAGDYLWSSEHIMALSIQNLTDLANANFGDNGSYFRSEFNNGGNFYYLGNLFPIGERVSDIRYTDMWTYKTVPAGQQPTAVWYKKLIQRSAFPVLQMPLLRLSEMYLILTECAPDKATAEGYYSIYCGQKGIPFTTGFNASNWQTDRKNRMIREYCREFYAEGQTFFAYKRYNVTFLPSSWTGFYYSATTARYIVPKPDREINYHNN